MSDTLPYSVRLEACTYSICSGDRASSRDRRSTWAMSWRMEREEGMERLMIHTKVSLEGSGKG